MSELEKFELVRRDQLERWFVNGLESLETALRGVLKDHGPPEDCECEDTCPFVHARAVLDRMGDPQ